VSTPAAAPWIPPAGPTEELILVKPPERLEAEQAPGIDCRSCGARNEPTRVFCHACGERLVPLPVVAPVVTPKTGFPIMLIVGVVVLIVAGLAAGILLGRVYVGTKATPAASVPAGAAASLAAASPSANVVPAAFVCTAVSGAATAVTATALDDVRLGKHDSYDGAVFAFGGGDLPGYKIVPVSPPFKLIPSGKAVKVQGSSFVRITFTPASALDANGKPVYTGPSDLKPGMPALRELVKIGDTKGKLDWIAGLDGTGCVRVTVLTSPSRIVIDFQH
jgi:hypothetical protein